MSRAAKSLPAEMVEAVVHALEPDHRHVHLHLLVDLRRRFTEEELVRALRGLVATFPVLGCRYRPGLWRDRWVPWEGDLARLCRVASVDDLDTATKAWASRRFRYLAEPPVRLAFFAHGPGGRLVLSLHHMVADGGGIKAAGAVLAARLCDREPSPPPTGDRALLGVARCLRLRDLPVLFTEMVRESVTPLSLLRVRPLRLPPPSGSGAADPRWVPVHLAGDRARQFVAACKAHGATINDALVATLARMAARRGDRGPVMVAYTVDLRRYLRQERARVTNLHGVTMVILDRERTGSTASAMEAVVDVIGEQKRRLTGLAYSLLPAFTVSWLPHGLLRRVGATLIRQIIKRFQRALAVTNIGALDEALAPFGDDAINASITGPFIHRNPVPVVTATGFRGTLTLQVVATHTHSQTDLETFATELATLLPPGPGSASTGGDTGGVRLV